VVAGDPLGAAVATAPCTSPTGVIGPGDLDGTMATPIAATVATSATVAMRRTVRPRPPRSRSLSGRGRLSSGPGVTDRDRPRSAVDGV
jgi:hypothetical protein